MNKKCPNEQRGQVISPRKNLISSAHRLENTIPFLSSSNFWWFLIFLSFSLPSHGLLHCVSHGLLRRTPIIGSRAYPNSVWPPPLTWIISAITLLPNKVILTCTRCWDSTYLFGGHNSTYNIGTWRINKKHLNEYRGAGISGRNNTMSQAWNTMITCAQKQAVP